MSLTKQQIANIILNQASKKKQIVYGQQSINQQIPGYLKKETKDYDIITPNPKRAAEELVKELGEDFEVVKGNYYRTYKVKSKSGETIADYTKKSRPPKVKLILGVRYADLEYSKRKIGKILRDESSSYRHDKDMDTLQRIRKGEVEIW